MKTTGVCPKCQGSVYTNKGNSNYGDRCAMMGGGSNRLFIEVYACFNCGYIEEYIVKEDLENEKKMNKISDKWKKVN